MNKLIVLPFKTGTIEASGTYTTEAIDLAKYANEWMFSLQFTVTGDGQVKIEPFASDDGITFVDTAIDVVAAGVKTGGPGSDGKYAPTAIALNFCRFLKLKFTEVGAADSVAAETYLAIK